MQLGYHYTLSTIDHECATGRHVRDIAQEHILNDRFKIHVLFVVTAQLQLCFQRHRVRKAALHTLFDSVTWRVNEIIQEFQYEDVSCVGDRKIFLEHTEQAFIVTLIGRSFKLEEILERLELDGQQVGRCRRVM